MKYTAENIVIAVMIITIIILSYFFGRAVMFDEASDKVTPENLYSINAEVIDRKGNEIFIRDLRDEIWSFDSDLAWEIGDEITVIFDTVNTDTIYDDKIISVDWIGQWEG